MTNKQALREELSNPAIGNKDHLRKIALDLLDELEAEKERSENLLRQARSFREAHDSAAELILRMERSKPEVTLPATRLWADRVPCFEAAEVISMLNVAGIRINREG